MRQPTDHATADLFAHPPPRQADPPRARHTDPETSHAAAATAARHHSSLDTAILDWLRYEAAGGTSEEIANGLLVPRVSVSPRLKPMERAGLVTRTDERRTGKSGVRAIVWRAS